MGGWFSMGNSRSENNTTRTRYGRWRRLRCRGPAEQLFAIGDVHGQSEALEAALNAISNCPSDSPARHLIFLGDLIDRGPDSMGSVKLAMDAYSQAGVDLVTLLPGNHELMLLDGLLEPDLYLSAWLYNGGDALIKELDPDCTAQNLSDVADIVWDAFDHDFLLRMTKGPTWHLAGDLLFVHAGLQPEVEPVSFLSQRRFWANNNHWAWIREPFLSWRGGWGPEGAWVVVHGHTPAVTKKVDMPEFSKAADLIRLHRRLCLDAGAAYGFGQVAWAEFGLDQYRVCLSHGSGAL